MAKKRKKAKVYGTLPKPSRVVECLERAKTLITSKGWCQHYLMLDDEGEPTFEKSLAKKYCALGALENFRNAGYAADVLNKILATDLGNSGDILTEWNDNPKRKKRDVIRLFTRGIAFLRTAKGKATYKDMYKYVDFDGSPNGY